MPREAVMTRKHYEMIAATINTLDLSMGESTTDYTKMVLRERTAITFAKTFAEIDRTFSTELFLAGALKRDRKRAQKLTNGASASSEAA